MHINNWLLAIRPKTLFASVSPVLLGLALAGQQTGHINTLLALLTILCALFLQIASNLANDYLDALKGTDDETRLGPVRVTSSGLISVSRMRNALLLSLALAFLSGIYLVFTGGLVILLIGLCGLYFAYGYTGGPFPLSYNGLGEFSAFIFFGIIAVFGTYYLQTHSFSWHVIIAGMGPGFISACTLAVNNLRDIESDGRNQKRTLAVRFGVTFQRWLCLTLVILSVMILLSFIVIYQYYTLLPVLLLPLLFIRTWQQLLHGNIDQYLNNALARTAQYNLLYCLLFSAALSL